VITLSGAAREASGGMQSGVQALEAQAHQHSLFRHFKNEFFQQKFRPKYA